jgi:hypothetical protein
MTSLGPSRLTAANISNERINQIVKSTDRTIRAAQKHSDDGINRSVKPT